ncbi:protein-tyrosine phosphatase family protein [Burkholderia vietnamiensis]|uniref:hypothetical protein n=1 Tax=Burkholderia vietnamiensis TaxID=60552 RepID=UPI001CF373A8|nr:hypothetical protein [Burkholderia vietnamiensis]MCA8198494.1 hypothetical protein [Burkholderia vietnamiensis]
MIRSVEYTSEADLLGRLPSAATGVISITEPGRSAPIPEGWGAIHRVRFADAEWDDAMVERLRARGRKFDPQQKGFPSEQSAREILAALRTLHTSRDVQHVIVHCHAGKRRSAAVAKFIALRCGLTFDHDYDGYNRTVLRLLLHAIQANQNRSRVSGRPSLIARWLSLLFSSRDKDPS